MGFGNILFKSLQTLRYLNHPSWDYSLSDISSVINVCGYDDLRDNVSTVMNVCGYDNIRDREKEYQVVDQVRKLIKRGDVVTPKMLTDVLWASPGNPFQGTHTLRTWIRVTQSREDYLTRGFTLMTRPLHTRVAKEFICSVIQPLPTTKDAIQYYLESLQKNGEVELFSRKAEHLRRTAPRQSVTDTFNTVGKVMSTGAVSLMLEYLERDVRLDYEQVEAISANAVGYLKTSCSIDPWK